MALSSEQVNAIYKQILEEIANGLDSGELEEYEAAEIAQYCIDKVERLDAEVDKYRFFEELSTLWPYMEVLMEEKKVENIENTEKEVAEGAITLLSHGKVDEALGLVKTVTQN